MTVAPPRAPTRGFTPVAWSDDGAPRSGTFDDIYFSTADGLGETRAVFLDGCGLPGAWVGRDRFTVGELGFGSGLNILALIDLWRRTREPGAAERFFHRSLPDQRRRRAAALAGWPELADLAVALTGALATRGVGIPSDRPARLGRDYRPRHHGCRRALEAWTGAADAWFLDGFAPSRNPDMWSERVLAGVAAHSAPGARAATFTVAGAVRRRLARPGFVVEKKPGFGRKNERLEARLPGAPATTPVAQREVAIIGAGDRRRGLGAGLPRLGTAPDRVRCIRGRAPALRATLLPWSCLGWTRAAETSPPSTPRPWPGGTIFSARRRGPSLPVGPCSWRPGLKTPAVSTASPPALYCHGRGGASERG